MSARMLLHCGGFTVPKKELIAYKKPRDTETYQSIAHIEGVEMTLDAIAKNGLKVKEERYAIAREGDVFFGLINLDHYDERSRMGYSVIIRNSYGRQTPFEIGAGSNCFICDNTAFSAQHRLKLRHTHNSDYLEGVNTIVGQLPVAIADFTERIEALKKNELSDRDAFNIVRLMTTDNIKLLKASEAIEVMAEYLEPSFPEFEEFVGSEYGLFQAMTHQAKAIDKPQQFDRRLVEISRTFAC